MATRGSVIFPILLMIAQFCMTQIHPEPHWMIPIVSDEHGNLCFGDPFEQNETAEVQSPPDESKLTDEVPSSVNLLHEVFVELSPVHISQPQAIRIQLTDEDIESLSASLYQPLHTFMRTAEVHQNIANPGAHQPEISYALSQEPVATDIYTESIDLGTLLTCRSSGPLSVDGLNTEPLLDVAMEILLNDTSQAGNALMTCAKHRLNTSHRVAHLQVPVAFFDSINKNIENAKEQQSTNLARPEFSTSDYRQPARSIRNNSGQSLLQFGSSKYHFVNQTGHKPIKCDVCQKQFRKPSGWQDHRRIHTGEKPFQCDMCAKVFRTSGSYHRHRRIHTNEKPFQCDICTKQFRTSGDYKTHRRIHTGEKPFQCGICLKQFRTSSDYQKHRRTHTDKKPFQCDMCAKQLRTFADYNTHRRIHTDEKLFKCDICPKTFRTSGGYQAHRRIHTGEKPFKCDFCLKNFSDPSSYRRHRRAHTNEKPFECDICEKLFRYSEHYKTHRRTHTGDKPFECDFCCKKFSDFSNYRRHRRTHTRVEPSQCDIYAKEFHTSSNHQRRREIPTNKKLYTCDSCNQDYCSKRALVKHAGKCSPRNVSCTAIQ